MATTHASQPAGWSDGLAVLIDAIERLWTRFRSWRARRETVHMSVSATTTPASWAVVLLSTPALLIAERERH